MQLLSDRYFSEYKALLNVDIVSALEGVQAGELTPSSFTFYTSVAVMSSSRIEGELLEVDSYVKHKMQQVDYIPELLEKPNDLYSAYAYAHEHKLTRDHFLHSHSLITQHLLPERSRGVYRKSNMVVMEHNTGRVQFEAAPFDIVPGEMDKLWHDIDALTARNLSEDEVFYYASCIHLMFVCIHPFNDGNGRAARLLEKWFLATCLGAGAWRIPSEQYYYSHVNEYYLNLNRAGVFYEQLDLSKAFPFLLMLPQAIK
jgi:Fic family protein